MAHYFIPFFFSLSLPLPAPVVSGLLYLLVGCFYLLSGHVARLLALVFPQPPEDPFFELASGQQGPQSRLPPPECLHYIPQDEVPRDQGLWR